MKTLFAILLSIIGFNSFCQDEFLSGLFFSSHEVIQDKRTSLNLAPEEPFKFTDGFTLEFDANFREGDGYYGYIFRIIGDGNTNIDFVSNNASETSNFWLVLKDTVLFSYKWADIPNAGINKWIKTKIEIDTKNSKLHVYFNGKEQEVVVPDIAALETFDIAFGACRNVNFSNTDVSPMTVKDVRIFDTKDNLLHYWKLSKHANNAVYDEVSNLQAGVENPIWNIDKHVEWEKKLDIKIDGLLGIAKDEENGRLFFVNNQAIYVYASKNGTIDTITYKNGLPYSSLGNQIIYNKYSDELWSYNFSNTAIRVFDFKTSKWSKTDDIVEEPSYWHHNKFISPIDSSLTTLLGYGFYTYKNTVKNYNNKSKLWEEFEGKQQINPRYLSGIGFLNNEELLVFGGYGSTTGRQELSPEYYYDLFSLNLKNHSFNKLWTLPSPEIPFVPVDALIVEQQTGDFYTLIYNRDSYKTFLHLAKFRIYENEYYRFNDSIPYNFLDTESMSTLLLNKETSKLVAVTSNKSDVSIYSIAFPPLMPYDVYQTVHKPKKNGFLLGSIILLIVVLFIILAFIIKRRNNRKSGLHADFDNTEITPIPPYERQITNAIYFIGGFQLFNNKGEKITASFSPTVRQLFLFIFMNTIKDNKGVSSLKLDEVLWYDKSGDSARNNRNVNISKLRHILSEIDGIELLKENSYWRFTFEEPLFCDYLETRRIVNKSKSSVLSENEINTLIALLMAGEFLPLLQADWIDKFKALFTNEITDGFASISKSKEVNKNLSLMYHLSECIFLHEPLNDEALITKCTILYKIGKISRAKKTYDSFCKDYKKALGINYAVAFKEIIK